MHELSIAMSIVEAALEAAPQDGQVLAVHVRVGLLSGVVKEALDSAWQLARLDSPLSAAELVIEEVPVAANCQACKVEREIDSIQWLCCPVCGAPATDLVRGKELDLVALEIGS